MSLAKLRDEIKVIQASARSLDDISSWFVSNAELLRSACLELNYKPQNVYYDQFGASEIDLYAEPATVTMSMEGLDTIGVFNPIAYKLDKLSHYAQVNVNCTFSTDETISIEHLCDSVPELGIVIDMNSIKNRKTSSWIRREIFLQPSKWPLAAATMLKHLGHQNDTAEARYARAVLEHVFPAMPWTTFAALVDVDVFSSPGVLCDMLMENEQRAAVAKTSASTPLPTDLQ